MKKRHKTYPRWQIVLLWIYLLSSIFIAICLIYLYQFPSSIRITGGHHYGNHTCIMYKGAGYCCADNYWLLITDIDIYDNITDDNIGITECYKLEKIKSSKSYPQKFTAFLNSTVFNIRKIFHNQILLLISDC